MSEREIVFCVIGYVWARLWPHLWNWYWSAGPWRVSANSQSILDAIPPRPPPRPRY